MTAFRWARAGDLIQLHRIYVHLNAHSEDWSRPLRLITEPAPCDDPGCAALRCEALTPDGRLVHLHRAGWREIDVLEPVSELAAHGGDDQTAPPLTPRDPANPAEAEMTPTDDDLYRMEKDT